MLISSFIEFTILIGIKKLFGSWG